MSTLNRIRAVNQASIHDNYQTYNVGVEAPPHRSTFLDDVDDEQVQFWLTLAERSNWSLPQVVQHLRGQTAFDP